MVPRRPRFEVEGGLFHVTSRAVAGADLYRADKDREAFLAAVDVAVRRFGWLCHAFCLMTNHFHLFLQTMEPTLATGMQWLNTTYVCGFNKRYARRGHLVQGRYCARLIESEAHFLEVVRYIPLNPARARICADPAAWPWSSYRATAGLDFPPRFLHLDAVYRAFGGGPEVAQRRYREFVAQGCPADSLDGLLAVTPGVRPGSDPGQTP